MQLRSKAPQRLSSDLPFGRPRHPATRTRPEGDADRTAARAKLPLLGLLAAIVTGTLAGLVGCGRSPSDVEIDIPASVQRDLLTAEKAATLIEADLLVLVLEPLARGQIEVASGALTEDFIGRRFDLVRDGSRHVHELAFEPLAPAVGKGAVVTDRAAYLASLASLGDLGGMPPERVECEVFRFELDAGTGLLATGEARLRWTGPKNGAGRVDVTLYGEFQVAYDQASREWNLERLRPLAVTPTHPHGAGYRITSEFVRFADRTDEVGLTFGTSEANRGLVQDFIDQHRTLSLGGLSAVDWNRDGFPDLLATRAREEAVLFLNDGRSGFVPTPLPIKGEVDAPAHALFVDLDGDGLEELVGAAVTDYEGDRAFAGLWTRTGATDGEWRHIPRAFALPNPVGLRRLDVQTVVPIDVEGDGDLDLFFAVYGSAKSRGDAYNTVEAYDGADNHLFIGEDLVFTEESDARGIVGTGYSYIGLGFDVDHDGDTDLFEGNDFGPNVLWRNDGGRFEADESLGLGGVSAYTMGAALADLEADGRWDLYVSNMSSEQGMRMVRLAGDITPDLRAKVDTIARGNMLYSERGQGQPWIERAQPLGIADAEWAWGCQFIDAFGDGELGLAVTNGFASHRDQSLGDWQSYYWRQVLDDATALKEERLSRDVNAGERFLGSFNGYERDRFFIRHTEGGQGADPALARAVTWFDASYCVGLDADHDGRAIVPIDADGDGDIDLATLTLDGLVYSENTGPAPVRWTRLRLEATASHAAALGARVYVTDNGVTRARHVALVEGFQSQVLADIHVGLGTPAEESTEGDAIEQVRIEWPSGHSETLENVQASAVITIREGSGIVNAAELPRWTAGGPVQAPSTVDWATQLVRAARPSIAIDRPNAPLVVRVLESPEARTPLFPLPAGPPQDVRVVDAFLRTGADSERSLLADTAVLIGPELFADATRYGLPATFVYTPNGHLVRAFYGAGVLPTDVLAFCDRARDEPIFRYLSIEHGRLALRDGRFRDAVQMLQGAARDEATLRPQDAVLYEALGRAWAQLGRLDRSAAAYERATTLDPDYALGHFNLAATHIERNEFEDARAALLEVLRIEGTSRRALGSLAEACSALGELEEARGYVQRWLDKQPSDSEMLVLLGKLFAQDTMYDKASDAFERALAADSSNGEARSALAVARKLLAKPR